MSPAAEHRADQQQPQHGQGRARAEWVPLSLATVIVLAVAGQILFFWITVPQGPPIITIRPAGAIRAVGEQFYVPFEVKNVGGTAATAIGARAELRINGEVVEQSVQQISFLSRGETDRGAFVFTHDPHDGDLSLSIGSYEIP